MQNEIKICNIVFHKIGKCDILPISEKPSEFLYRFFLILAFNPNKLTAKVLSWVALMGLL